MARLVYLDQNAWVALAKGSWNKIEFPREHAALTKVVEEVRSGSIMVPLSFANIYETAKINDLVRSYVSPSSSLVKQCAWMPV